MRKFLNKKVVVSLLIIVAFVFLLLRIYKEKDVLLAVDWKFNSTNFLLLVILLILNYLSNIVAWHILMKSLGQKLSFKENFRIWALSTITRFLPGKIWQYPSRIYMLSEVGVPSVVSGTAILAEILFNLGFGGLVVLLASANSVNRLVFFLISLPFIFWILSSKTVLGNLIFLIKKASGKNLEVLNKIKFSHRYIFPIAISFIIRFIISGSTLFCLVGTLTSVNISSFPIFVGAFSLSWLLGYLSFFSPAGLGVAEISLATLLSPVVPFSVGSIIAIIYRLITLSTELMIVGFQLVFYKK